MAENSPEDRDTMIVYRSFYESIKALPKENQAEVWEAVFEYGFNFNELELSGLSKAIFTLIKPIIGANIKRWKNGNKPKAKQDVSKTEAKQKQSESNIEANKDKDNDGNKDNDNNEESLSLVPPSAKPQKGKKKTRIEMTKEKAIVHYKTESKAAIASAPEEGEKYANIGREICGMKTVECPSGMVNTVMRLPDQLTFEQYQRLCAKLGGHNAVRDMLLAMHNDFDRYELAKQQSVSLIAQKWFTNGKKRDAKNGGQSSGSLSNPIQVDQ